MKTLSSLKDHLPFSFIGASSAAYHQPDQKNKCANKAKDLFESKTGSSMLLKYLSTLMNEIQNVGTPRVPFGHLAVKQNNFKIRFNILRSTCPFIKCSVVNQLKGKENPSLLLQSDGDDDDQMT